jgi:diguanylate cyclase (GGDEF)-like protein
VRQRPTTGRAATGRVIALTSAFAAFVAFLLAQPPRSVVTVVVDIATITVAGAATLAAARRAWTLQGRARTSWTVMAAAFGAATVGEAIWGWYELVLGRETPFPSLADVAYLFYPVLALTALLLRPATALAGQGRLRAVLDGLLVAGSLFTISWATALGSTYADGGTFDLAFGIALAYPVTDLVLLTTVLIVVSHAPGRLGLGVLAAGLAVQALSDSAYTYLSMTGSYATGNLLDAGYVLGYLLLMEAALRDRPVEAEGQDRGPSWTAMLLPYVPAGAGITVAALRLPAGIKDPTVLVAAGLVVVLFSRQLLTLVDNRRLLLRVMDGQERLQHQAFHDSLTSLANRALFLDRVDHAVELHRRSLRPASVLLLDLDDFKSVNDGLGHAAGDALLIRVADRLLAATRSGDTVARLGGDEFAVLLEDDVDPLQVAQRVLEALDQPVMLEGRALPVHASIGIAVLSADASPLDQAELIKRADVAMYAAKQAGKGTAVLYEAGMTDASDELDLRADLVAAVRAESLDVHFQPIFTPLGELLGFEALSRWTRDGQSVSPDQFIPAAERAGVLRTLDEIVLRRALTFATTGVGRDHALFVTVNAGMEHLTDPELPEQLARLLDSYGLDPSHLVVEVPENRAYRDRDRAAATMRRLRQLGVRLALDDFGVGYSSLARLQELPPDIVKIDRCFVAPLAEASADTSVLAGMIDLAHRTGAFVVAEGVELPEQLHLLERLGCDAVQGFLLGRPVSAEEAGRVPRLAGIPRPRSSPRETQLGLDRR